jgi:hypothetical protein
VRAAQAGRLGIIPTWPGSMIDDDDDLFKYLIIIIIKYLMIEPVLSRNNSDSKALFALISA